MSDSEIREELHKIIDQIEDESTLIATYNLLSSRNDMEKKSGNNRVLKEKLDNMLKASEEDIEYGRVSDHKAVSREIQSWRKK